MEFLILLALYLLPTIIAVSRRHLNSGAILALNLLLGWTLLGWVLALVWSLTNSATSHVSALPAERPLSASEGLKRSSAGFGRDLSIALAVALGLILVIAAYWYYAKQSGRLDTTAVRAASRLAEASAKPNDSPDNRQILDGQVIIGGVAWIVGLHG